jgi:ABC-2 type transport system ATP-binding protein
MVNAIEVENLNKSFRVGFWGTQKKILHHVSFRVPLGQTTGFVGNNGSGKTTSLKCILQFIHPDSGNIHFFGKPLSFSSKNRLGYLPERPYLYEFLTGLEYLKFHWNLADHSEPSDFRERALEALGKVNLLEAKDVVLRKYSKGMLQRVGIAQAILHRPELLILDEPMSGLDPDGRFLVKEILREEQKRGTTIFFSSHLLQDMEELCTHLCAIHQGKIIHDGPLTSFVREHASLEKAFQVHKENQR